jgi:hypothetical protein
MIDYSLFVCAVFGLIGGFISNMFLGTAKGAEPQQQSSVVRAERFEVIGKDGKTRAVFGDVVGFTGPELEIGSHQGEHIELVSNGLAVYDKKGAIRMNAGLFSGNDVPDIERNDDKNRFNRVVWSTN